MVNSNPESVHTSPASLFFLLPPLAVDAEASDRIGVEGDLPLAGIGFRDALGGVPAELGDLPANRTQGLQPDKRNVGTCVLKVPEREVPARQIRQLTRPGGRPM